MYSSGLLATTVKASFSQEEKTALRELAVAGLLDKDMQAMLADDDHKENSDYEYYDDEEEEDILAPDMAEDRGGPRQRKKNRRRPVVRGKRRPQPFNPFVNERDGAGGGGGHHHHRQPQKVRGQKRPHVNYGPPPKPSYHRPKYQKPKQQHYKPKPHYKPRPSYHKPKQNFHQHKQPNSYHKSKPKPSPPVKKKPVEENNDSYGSPQADPVESEEDTYGSPQAPASQYEEPAKQEENIDEYGSPKAPPAKYEEPAQEIDEYGSPKAPPTSNKQPQPSYPPKKKKPRPSYQKPSYKPKPKYKPKPVYKPKPKYKPRPAYKPKPAYKPRPQYKPRPRPHKKPKPASKPAQPIKEEAEDEYGSPEAAPSSGYSQPEEPAPSSGYSQPEEAAPSPGYSQPEPAGASDEYGSPASPASSGYSSPEEPAEDYGSPDQPTYQQETYNPESFDEIKPSDFPIEEIEEPSYTPSMVTTFKPPTGLFNSLQGFGFPDFPMPMFPDLTPSFDEAAFESFKGNQKSMNATRRVLVLVLVEYHISKHVSRGVIGTQLDCVSKHMHIITDIRMYGLTDEWTKKVIRRDLFASFPLSNKIISNYI